MESIHLSGELVAIIVFVMLTLLGLAVGYGALQQKVKNNREKIKENKNDFEKYCEQNRQDHKEINKTLNNILTSVNGDKK